MSDLRCFAYSYATDLKISAIRQAYKVNYKLTDFNDVVHFKLQDADILPDEGDVFVFSFGAIVFWGLTEAQESKIIKELNSFIDGKLGGLDDDLYTYSYSSDLNASIKEDHLKLPNSGMLTKLACSYGLAQSVKLGGFEEKIQSLIETTKDIPEKLATTGKINLSRKSIKKIMGSIFIERNTINLHLEFLDIPNFFWDHTDLEPLYETVVEYMGQTHRVKVLNQRLAVMKELIDMLDNELANQNSSKLEWIIIILILVEVLVVLAKEVLHII